MSRRTALERYQRKTWRQHLWDALYGPSAHRDGASGFLTPFLDGATVRFLRDEGYSVLGPICRDPVQRQRWMTQRDQAIARAQQLIQTDWRAALTALREAYDCQMNLTAVSYWTTDKALHLCDTEGNPYGTP